MHPRRGDARRRHRPGARPREAAAVDWAASEWASTAATDVATPAMTTATPGSLSSEPPPWASSLPLARPLVSPRSNLQQGEDGADGAAEAIAWTTAPAPSAYSPVDTPIWLRWPTGVSNNLCRSSPLATPPHLSCTYSFASIPCLISNFILKFSHCQYISFMDVWMY
jgi:hypothetical protein